jgi:NADPH:quinone reductase-like Zn-dependent oxidoreductase
MKAVTSSRSAGVAVVDVQKPEPSAGQVLVRVTAAAITPGDVGVSRSGPWNRTLGWEAAGVIESVGQSVRDLRPGDAVMGWSYWLSSGRGAQAEYAVFDASATALRPRSADAAHASTLPLDGTTAWQALAELDAKPGESLLILGAAGSIGGFVLDLAVAQGLEVWGVASAGDGDFVTGLGAHFVARGDTAAGAVLGARPSGIDKALATAPVEDTWRRVIRPGGRFLSTVGQSMTGVDSGYLNAHPDAGQLTALAERVDRGELRLRVAGQHTFDDAAAAYAQAAAPGVRGRVVLTP